MNDTPAVVPVKGMPATINLYTNTVAAVVFRVNPKSIVVCRVEVDKDSRRRVNDEAEPYPCYAWNGIVDKMIGEPERYPLVNGSYRRGSVSITLGRSVKITDYRE